jgi:hypothetical protein
LIAKINPKENSDTLKEKDEKILPVGINGKNKDKEKVAIKIFKNAFSFISLNFL